jgi:hypothetical protein
VNLKEAFKINKNKMMLAKIESREQQKDIMLNKSKLKEKKWEEDDDLAKEERETQNKLRELIPQGRGIDTDCKRHCEIVNGQQLIE